MDYYLHFYSDLNSFSALYIPPRLFLSLLFTLVSPLKLFSATSFGITIFISCYVHKIPPLIWKYSHNNDNNHLIFNLFFCFLIDTAIDSSPYLFRVSIFVTAYIDCFHIYHNFLLKLFEHGSNMIRSPFDYYCY